LKQIHVDYLSNFQRKMVEGSLGQVNREVKPSTQGSQPPNMIGVLVTDDHGIQLMSLDAGLPQPIDQLSGA
jgi:hypothetical protein